MDDASHQSAARPLDPAARHTPKARISRYLRGRRRVMPLRLAYEFSGAALTAWLVSPIAGLVALAGLLAGEFVEWLFLHAAERLLERGRPLREVQRLATIGALFWAIGISTGIWAGWSGATAAHGFLGLTYLAAASINAQLVGMLNRPAMLAMQGTFLLDLLLWTGQSLRHGELHDETLPLLAATAILAATLSGLFLRLARQSRIRREAEARLVAARDELAARHDALVNMTEALRRKADEARAAARAADAERRAKSTFLAMMSHELRTPLNAILGATELLADTRDETERRELMATLESAGRVLLGVVNDVLDLSRAEAGRLELAQEPLAPAGVVRDVARVLSPLAAERGLRLMVETPQVSCRVLGDPDRLRQVLLNLGANAVKFTEEGCVRLVLRARPARDHVKVTFMVADTGPGIPREALARIFEPFSQVNATGASARKGTGLGLAICRRLIEAMGGRLRAFSKPGMGSLFVVRLALPAATTGTHPDTARPGDGLPPGVHVLVVDDNAANRAILRRMLERAGARVSLAEDGEAAVHARLRASPDVMLLDLHMPGMDGDALLREIRRQESTRGLPPVPALAVTADTTPETVARLKAAGFAGQQGKPVRLETLLPAISRLVEVSATPRPDAAPASAPMQPGAAP